MTQTLTKDFVTLDPTSGPLRERDERPLGRALPTLDGVTVGLLANGKSNSMELLEAVFDELAKEFELRGSLQVRKDSVSVPPRPPDFERLVNETTAVVTAIGD